MYLWIDSYDDPDRHSRLGGEDGFTIEVQHV